MKTDFIGENAYPSLTAKNCTGPSTKDGTPVNDALVNDIWGFFQAATYQGGISPSENAESYLESDILNGIRNCCGVPGEVFYFAGNLSSAALLGARLLPLNGSIVLRSTYSLLDEYVYCGDENNSTAQAFYHCNIAGTRSTSGDYLKLLDLGGYFIRVNAYGPTTVDPGRSPMTIQSESIKEHSHSITVPFYPGYSGYVTDEIDLSGGGSYKTMLFYTSGASPAQAKTSALANGTETRPINKSLYAVIRY